MESTGRCEGEATSSFEVRLAVSVTFDTPTPRWLPQSSTTHVETSLCVVEELAGRSQPVPLSLELNVAGLMLSPSLLQNCWML